MAHKAASSKKSVTAIKYSQQAERLSGHSHDSQGDLAVGTTTAVAAKFVTPQDPVIETANGGRLPSVPVGEAQELNRLKNLVDGNDARDPNGLAEEPAASGGRGDAVDASQAADASATLRTALPPSRTNPLFPPLPLYGPRSWVRDVQCMGFRVSAWFLSLAFLGVIVLGAAATSLPLMFRHIGLRLVGRDPDARRPFYEEEKRRDAARRDQSKTWTSQRRRRRSQTQMPSDSEEGVERDHQAFTPTEGGRDPLVCDVGYYARRVGLDVEEYRVQTEDGFIIHLWHVYDPREHVPRSPSRRDHHGPDLFHDPAGDDAPSSQGRSQAKCQQRKPRYPVLLVHGLLQSSGAYCTNDDDSLAFFLCKR